MSSSNNTKAAARRVSRRAALGLLAALFAGRLAHAHTPYQQWVVYRKKHLLIGTDKSVAGSYELGKQLVAVLADKLPASRARVARAPNSIRVASLLATRQFEVALLPRDQAVALSTGARPFGDYGPLDLRTLFESDRFLLVCLEDFPDQHAFLVTSTLAQHNVDQRISKPVEEPPLPWHNGSAAFLQH